MTKVFEFIKNNLSNLLFLIGGCFLIYWVVYVLTPKVGMSEIEKAKIDSINLEIKKISKDNERIEKNIENFDYEINKIDNKITNIKSQREIIREYYYEKINRVDSLTNAELDSFFSKRYNY